jgi:hypothetical protein
MSKRGCQHRTHKEKEETYRNVLLYPKRYAYIFKLWHQKKIHDLLRAGPVFIYDLSLILLLQH